MQFWPVVGWVNHLYVPLQLRVVFHSIIACCWYAPQFPFLLLFLLLSNMFHLYDSTVLWCCLLSICRGIFLNLRARSMVLKKAWNPPSWYMNMETSPCVSWIENGSLELLILFWFSCFRWFLQNQDKVHLAINWLLSLFIGQVHRQNVAPMVMWKVVC